jgi:DNA-directed RNA polymerase subunit RPC12/RpoP
MPTCPNCGSRIVSLDWELPPNATCKECGYTYIFISKNVKR